MPARSTACAPADKGFFTSPMHQLLYWLRVAKDIRRSGCDVVHVANLTQAIPVIRRLNPDVRIVLHMHCEWLVQLDERLIDRRLRKADLIVGVQRPHHRADPAPLPAARRPLPDDLQRRRGRRAELDRGGRDDTVTLLHVGRISPEKGHHVLVEALNDVVREHPEVRLVLVGEESVVPAEWAVDISADPAVRDLKRFYGRSYLEQVKELMSPELAERTTFDRPPRPTRSARASTPAPTCSSSRPTSRRCRCRRSRRWRPALAVVSAPAGGAVESIRDGETGVFVARGDARALARAVTELVEDPARRAALGAAGRARAAEVFSWDGVAAEFETALRGAGGGEPPPAGMAVAAVAGR